MGDEKNEVNELIAMLNNYNKDLPSCDTRRSGVDLSPLIHQMVRHMGQAANALEAQQAEIAKLTDDLLFEAGRGDDRDAAVKLVGEQQAKIEQMHAVLNKLFYRHPPFPQLEKHEYDLIRTALANKDTGQ